EPAEVPQGRVVGLVAAEGAELVVVVVLDAGAGEPGVEALVELVGGARAAVQEQHLEVGIGPDPPGPDAELAAGGADRDHSRAAGQDVAGVPGRGVEVRGRGLVHEHKLAEDPGFPPDTVSGADSTAEAWGTLAEWPGGPVSGAGAQQQGVTSEQGNGAGCGVAADRGVEQAQARRRKRHTAAAWPDFLFAPGGA